MSNAKPAHSRTTSSRRQQLVNAALVGTVVVVLGFASGIGVETSTSAQQPSAPKTETSEPASPAPAQATTRPPVNYVGVALPPPATSAAPVATPTSSTPSTATSPTSTITTRPRTQTISPPTTSCSTDILGGLLDAVTRLVLPTGTLSGGSGGGGGSGLLLLVGGLLGSPGTTTGTGSLPLLGGVLDVLGLGGTAASPSSPATTADDLVPLVGDLLPGVLATTSGSPTKATPALVAACSDGLLGKLPLLGGTG